MKKAFFLVCLLSCLFPLSIQAQDTRKADNQNKIELVYKDVEVQRTDSRGNLLRSYNTQIPQIRINENHPIDIKEAMLEPYLQDCPDALRELELFKQKKKKSRQSALLGVTAGAGIAFAGLAITASSEGESIAPFAIGFDLGVGSIFYGISKGRKHRMEAYKQMEYTVSKYNRNCYDPRGNSSLITPEPANGDTVLARESPDSDGINRNYEVDQPYPLPDSPESFTYEVTPDQTPLGNIGRRLGYRTYSRTGINVQFEVGQRPGLDNSSDMLYVSATGMYSFGAQL